MKKKLLTIIVLSLVIVCAVVCFACDNEPSRAVSSVEVKSAPAKLTYKEGEELDLTGALLKVVYDNQEEEEIAVTAAMLSGYSADTVGEQTITITYQEKTASFKVNVEHDSVVDAAVAPTCTEKGLTEGSHCSVCNAVIVAQEEVAALGHNPVIDNAVPNSCTESGLTEGSHCSRCEEVLVAQQEVPAGHNPVTDDPVDPTCTEKGLTEGSHCDKCGTVLVAQEDVAALGHDYDEEIIKAATYYEDGSKSTSCSRCDMKPIVESFSFMSDFDYSSDMDTEHVWGTWTGGKGYITGDNTTWGDAQAVTTIYVPAATAFVMDFDVTCTAYEDEGDYGANIGYGITNPSDPGAKWNGVSLNFGQDNARMFGYGTPNSNEKTLLRLNGKKSVHVRLEITADKWVSYYVDGILAATFNNDDYNGGYISFDTWRSKAEWSNIRYYIGNDLGLTRGMYKSEKNNTHPTITNSWGTWNTSSDGLSIEVNNINDGDFFAVTDKHVTADENFTFEAYINVYEGEAAGLVFGIQDNTDPGASWFCLNIMGGGGSRYFKAGGNNPADLAEYKEISVAWGRGYHKLTIKTEGTSENKTFKFYCDDVLVGETTSSNYQGGYLALMTFRSNATFYDVHYTVA